MYAQLIAGDRLKLEATNVFPPLIRVTVGVSEMACLRRYLPALPGIWWPN